MKLFKLLLVSLSCFCFTMTYASAQLISEHGIQDVNPFTEKEKNLKDEKLEPNGLVVYSFSKNKNAINSLVKSNEYIRQTQATALNGYVEVDEREIRNFDNLQSKYKDYRQDLAMHSSKFGTNSIAQNKVKYVDGLVPSLLPEFIEVFSTPSGTYISGAGWDTTTKIYQHNQMGSVILTAWDFTHSDGGVIMDADAINQKINGNPAVIIVKQDNRDKRRGETVLSWANETHSYSIQVNKNVYLEGTLDQLLMLAESIKSNTDSYR